MSDSNMWHDKKTKCYKWIHTDMYGNEFLMCDNPFHDHGSIQPSNDKLLTLQLQDNDGVILFGDDE